MKNALLTLLLTTLTISTFTACQSSKKPQPSVENTNRFRTINATQTATRSRTVVCHNCTVKFKLSENMHKMSMKGNKVVNCPVCHHNYLHKATN